MRNFCFYNTDNTPSNEIFFTSPMCISAKLNLHTLERCKFHLNQCLLTVKLTCSVKSFLISRGITPAIKTNNIIFNAEVSRKTDIRSASEVIGCHSKICTY